MAVLLPSGRRTTMKPPPPMLPAVGWVTLSAKPTATAASTALPPFFKISTPTSLAAPSALLTAPWVPVATANSAPGAGAAGAGVAAAPAAPCGPAEGAGAPAAAGAAGTVAADAALVALLLAGSTGAPPGAGRVQPWRSASRATSERRRRSGGEGAYMAPAYTKTARAMVRTGPLV